MSTNTGIDDYKQLSIAERIQLVEDIWDSIATEQPASLELSDTQRAELRRRLAAHHADPSTAMSWEQVREKLFRRET